MTEANSSCSPKVVNSHLADLALRGDRIFGEFGVIVRFVRPDRHPACMKVTGRHSPGHFKARIPCDKIRVVLCDRNILSLDLREHVMQ
jgi:hypothetical protein